MLSDKMQEAINDQLNFELYSSYIYFAMSAWFENKNLTGMAKWMRVQAQEELLHVMRFYNYVNDRGGYVEMQEIKSPDAKWKGVAEIFEDALEHERKVTKRIDNLVHMAREEKDNSTENFLQWFVKEQVEEEASVDEVLQQLKLAGEQGAGLFMIDRELAVRTLVVPPDVKL